MKRITSSLALMAGLVFSGSASATLIDRGNGLIFDDVLNITWLQDANAGAGSPFDNGLNTTDGFMTWQNAVNWAANLVFQGFDDWRLPTTTQPDPNCSGQFDPGGGFPLQGFGFGCTGSEMGHLFNVDGITTAGPGPFTNIQSS